MIYDKLSRLLKPNCTIIEIGAHIGTDTLKLFNFQPLIYYAIEPDKRNCDRLKKIIDNRPDTQIIPVAISNTDGLQTFYYSSGRTSKGRQFTDANSLLKPIPFSRPVIDLSFDKKQVMCRTLDRLFYHLTIIDLIWMDVQGAELKVFEGATETLKRTKYIYTECQEGRYEKQPGLNLILDALPDWDIILQDGDNVLLGNMER